MAGKRNAVRQRLRGRGSYLGPYFFVNAAIAMFAELHMLGMARALSVPETTKKVVEYVGWLSTTTTSGSTKEQLNCITASGPELCTLRLFIPWAGTLGHPLRASTFILEPYS